MINANTETLYAVLRHWLDDRKGLAEIGTRSRSYVEHWHDPLVIASTTQARVCGSFIEKAIFSEDMAGMKKRTVLILCAADPIPIPGPTE